MCIQGKGRVVICYISREWWNDWSDLCYLVKLSYEGRLNDMKEKISAAKLVKCGTHKLSKDLFERVKKVSQEKKEKEKEKRKAEALAYHAIAMKSKHIREKH